jgi:hypothetical protein
VAVSCHVARGEFTSAVLPLSRGFLFARARAHLVPVQSQVRLGHSHGGPQAGPGATTTKCDVRTNLVLFPSVTEHASDVERNVALQKALDASKAELESMQATAGFDMMVKRSNFRQERESAGS